MENIKGKYTPKEFMDLYPKNLPVEELLDALNMLLAEEYKDKWNESKTITVFNNGHDFLPVPFFLRMMFTRTDLTEEDIDNMSIEEQITYVYLFLE